MTRPVSDLDLLARGFAHGNVVWVGGARPGLIDTGYCTGAEALTLWLGDRTPSRVLLTHAHSDHSGGVAALVDRHGCEVLAHPTVAANVSSWDDEVLWLGATGQDLPRFSVDREVRPGDQVQLGDRSWLAIEAGGHARGGLAFLSDGVLVTGDALWEDGFGLLDPWVDGPGVFADAAAALDRLEQTEASVVIPGHGLPFMDLHGAIERARGRLAYLEENPERLRAQVVRNGVGFWRLHHPEASDREVHARTQAMAALHTGPWPQEADDTR